MFSVKPVPKERGIVNALLRVSLLVFQFSNRLSKGLMEINVHGNQVIKDVWARFWDEGEVKFVVDNHEKSGDQFSVTFTILNNIS